MQNNGSKSGNAADRRGDGSNYRGEMVHKPGIGDLSAAPGGSWSFGSIGQQSDDQARGEALAFGDNVTRNTDPPTGIVHGGSYSGSLPHTELAETADNSPSSSVGSPDNSQGLDAAYNEDILGYYNQITPALSEAESRPQNAGAQGGISSHPEANESSLPFSLNESNTRPDNNQATNTPDHEISDDHTAPTKEWIDELEETYAHPQVAEPPSEPVPAMNSADHPSRRLTVRQRPPELLITPSRSTFDQDGAPDSERLSGTALSGASSRKEASISPTLSELDLRRQLSGSGLAVDNDPYGIGLSSPASSTNSVVGGDFDHAWGSFSRARRQSPFDSFDSDAESGPPPSSEGSSSSSEGYSPRSPLFGGFSIEIERQKETIERQRNANSELHQTIAEQSSKIQRLESESAVGLEVQARRLKTHFKATLQAFNILPHDRTQPIWKQDSDGSRIGPLYDDVPNIYRETAVEILLCRAALKKMLKDFNGMVTIASKALVTAEGLKFAPLTARCHFIHGVALYHALHFQDALQEFQLSHGCADQYGITDDLIKEWCDGCINAIDSPWSVPSENVTEDSPIDFAETRFRARKIWGSPADVGAKEAVSNDPVPITGTEKPSGNSLRVNRPATTATVGNQRDPTIAERRRRAGTVLRAGSLPRMNPGASPPAPTTASGNYYNPAVAGAGLDYDPTTATRRPRTSTAVQFENPFGPHSAASASAITEAADNSYDPAIAGRRPRTGTAIRFENPFGSHSEASTSATTRTASNVDEAGRRPRTSTTVRFDNQFGTQPDASISATTEATPNRSGPGTTGGDPRTNRPIRKPSGARKPVNYPFTANTTGHRSRATSLFHNDPKATQPPSNLLTPNPTADRTRASSLFAGIPGGNQTPNDLLTNNQPRADTSIRPPSSRDAANERDTFFGAFMATGNRDDEEGREIQRDMERIRKMEVQIERDRKREEEGDRRREAWRKAQPRKDK